MAVRWANRRACVLSAMLSVLGVAHAATVSNEDPNGARVIVRYKSTATLKQALSAGSSTLRVGPQQAFTMSQRTGLSLADGHMLDGRTQVLHGDNSISSAALAARLKADPDVEFAVPDLRRRALAVPNDPLFAAATSISPTSGQWYLRAPDATTMAGINAVAAWDITKGNPQIVVADIDSGVLFGHPDLANKLLPGRNMVSANAVRNADGSSTGNGVGWSADASDPGDYTSRYNQCGDGDQPRASSWHGTKVIGLIGAETGNGIGMASVGHDVKLLPVRALSTCGGYDSDIIAAMLWAAGIPLPANNESVTNPGGVPINPNPARVINLSLGSVGSCAGTGYELFLPQILAKGVTVVAAAGNNMGLGVSVPANCPGVIAVAGVRHVGTKQAYSNVGPEVALAAPMGNCGVALVPCQYMLLSTTNGGTTVPTNTYTYTNGNTTDLGTSYAAPLVAGTAALMLSVDASLTSARIKQLLQTSARPFPSSSADATTQPPVCQAASSVEQQECICTTGTCGAGLLDAGAAVALTQAQAGPPPVAQVMASSTEVVAGSQVTLSDGGSTASVGRSIVGWQWAITTGGGLATLSGPTDTRTATLVTNAAGTVVVSLTVTDSAGATNTTTQPITVAAAPVVVTSSSGGGGGGGALGWGWLVGLALAVAALWRRPAAAS